MDDASSSPETAGADGAAPAGKPNSLGARNVAHVAHGYGNLDALERTPPLVVTGGKGRLDHRRGGPRIHRGRRRHVVRQFRVQRERAGGRGDRAVPRAALLPLADRQGRPSPWGASPSGSRRRPMCRWPGCSSPTRARRRTTRWSSSPGYYHNAIGKPEKKKIVSRFMGFHGVTCGAASVTGIPQMHADFDLPVNDLFLKTDCPHFYRYGEPGESEEDFATRLAKQSGGPDPEGRARRPWPPSSPSR